jgi:voltage-gated potassium channel
MTAESPEKQALDNERLQVLQQLDEWLEIPMFVLGLAWLVLLIVEFIWGISPLLQLVVDVIWVLFIIDFVIRFILAPRKLTYIKSNWLTVISLLLPALRIFRVFSALRILRLARTARTLRLVRILGSLNRGMRSLSRAMGRRGFGYVMALTLVLVLVGAAGIYNFESTTETGQQALPNYGSALWWTAMLITTVGSEYWPQTAEGRILTFILAVYAFAVFGYITATLATFFIDSDAGSDETKLAGAHSVEALRAEIVALRTQLQALSQQNLGSIND